MPLELDLGAGVSLALGAGAVRLGERAAGAVARLTPALPPWPPLAAAKKGAVPPPLGPRVGPPMDPYWALGGSLLGPKDPLWAFRL